jgi:hypothetical protein
MEVITVICNKEHPEMDNGKCAFCTIDAIRQEIDNLESALKWASENMHYLSNDQMRWEYLTISEIKERAKGIK